MKTKQKKILTSGVFDLFHLGHLRLFKKTKLYGDYLIVAVQSDKYAKKFKPEAAIIYNIKKRIEMIESIKYVDEVISYNTIDELVERIQYDVLVVGEDQNNVHFNKAIAYSKAMNKEVIVLERTKNISSSDLKEKIERIFW
jgi:glycerol-3-phosphate cytidylyltransferase